MTKSKRKSPASTPKSKAKRQKPNAQAKLPPPPKLTQTQRMKMCVDHVNMCVARINMLVEHNKYIQAKLHELAMLTNAEMKKFRCQIQDLHVAMKMCHDDTFQLCPDFDDVVTSPQAPVEIVDPVDSSEMMSEETLIQCVGDFVETLG